MALEAQEKLEKAQENLKKIQEEASSEMKQDVEHTRQELDTVTHEVPEALDDPEVQARVAEVSEEVEDLQATAASVEGVVDAAVEQSVEESQESGGGRTVEDSADVAVEQEDKKVFAVLSALNSYLTSKSNGLKKFNNLYFSNQPPETKISALENEVSSLRSYLDQISDTGISDEQSFLVTIEGKRHEGDIGKWKEDIQGMIDTYNQVIADQQEILQKSTQKEAEVSNILSSNTLEDITQKIDELRTSIADHEKSIDAGTMAKHHQEKVHDDIMKLEEELRTYETAQRSIEEAEKEAEVGVGYNRENVNLLKNMDDLSKLNIRGIPKADLVQAADELHAALNAESRVKKAEDKEKGIDTASGWHPAVAGSDMRQQWDSLTKLVAEKTKSEKGENMSSAQDQEDTIQRAA